MEIREISNKEIWEKFLSECSEKTFLDSWNWGEFQKKEGNKIWRMGIYDNSQIIGAALVIKIKARRGTFIFVPHGPIVIKEKEQALALLLNRLKEIARQEKACFIRIAPISERTGENIKIFKDLGFKNAPIHMHPEITWELDISLPEDELLSGMRKTTRYLIKQAQKNQDIEIVKSQDIDNIKDFNELYEETSRRHKFTSFSLNYLNNEFSSFSNEAVIFLGKYKGKVVSSAIVIYWQNMAFYHQGASLSEYSKIPVSYLLQWEAIKEAKSRGCRLYNFWGIVPDNKNNHPWAGLTLFKMGFGGRQKEYVKTQDLPLSYLYYPIYAFEKLRQIKRGL